MDMFYNKTFPGEADLPEERTIVQASIFIDVLDFLGFRGLKPQRPENILILTSREAMKKNFIFYDFN
jgi:hypothetical protein